MQGGKIPKALEELIKEEEEEKADQELQVGGLGWLACGLAGWLAGCLVCAAWCVLPGSLSGCPRYWGVFEFLNPLLWHCTLI